jgi:putative hydrolase of HD superfamily
MFMRLGEATQTHHDLKAIERHNRLFDGSRNENAAEHSWHLVLMALSMAEYAPVETNISHTIQLLIVHDLVEVHAGDHWAGDSDPAQVTLKERDAAARLFSLLPPDQALQFVGLWHEYEARQTPEARFAKALDALHPMLMVWGPGGSDYIHTPLTAAYMRQLKRPALEPFPALWAMSERLLDSAVARAALPA